MERIPKIGFVTTWLDVGGVDTFILRLGKFLKSAGMNIEVITTEGKGSWYNLPKTYGIPTYDLSPNATYQCLHSYRIGVWLRNASYDIVLLNHAKFAQASLGLLKDSTVAIPILHSTGQYCFDVGLKNSSCWNAAVCIGPKIYEIAKSLCPQKPIKLIPHGVEVPSSGTIQRKSPNRLIELIYIGRLSVEKGVTLLPEIVDCCRQRNLPVRLTIIGDGPLSQELYKRVWMLELNNSIELYGAVQPDLVYSYFQRAHILLLPSLFDGFPMASMEAHMCGCVPIATYLQGVTDVLIDDGETGFLIPSGDINRFAERIEFLQRNPEVWSAMSEKGRKNANIKFAFEKTGMSYLELIEDALAGKFSLKRSRRYAVPINPSVFTSYASLAKTLLKTVLKKFKNFGLSSYT